MKYRVTVTAPAEIFRVYEIEASSKAEVLRLFDEMEDIPDPKYSEYFDSIDDFPSVESVKEIGEDSVCRNCGAIEPAGRSCICRDNHCE